MRNPTRARTLGTILAASFLALAPTLAQAQRLPSKSRAEQQVDDINRNLQGQQRNLRQNQQNQFETNQLRNEIQRDFQFRSQTGPGSGLGCPAGSIGC